MIMGIYAGSCCVQYAPEGRKYLSRLNLNYFDRNRYVAEMGDSIVEGGVFLPALCCLLAHVDSSL